MEILQIPGQFIYEALVVLPRKRKETRRTFWSTTVYEIASISRDRDVIGEMVFNTGTRASGFPSRPARRVRFSEYGGRLWKPAGPNPVLFEEYAALLANWAARDPLADMDARSAAIADPIIHSTAPRQRSRWPSGRPEESDTKFFGRIARSDRAACEARYRGCAKDVLFIDGVLHYPVPAPVWQCFYDNAGPVVALVELRNAVATDGYQQRCLPRCADDGHLFWPQCFALDRRDDAVASFIAQNPGLTVRGNVEAMPPGYSSVSPLAYDLASNLQAGLLDRLSGLTHLLSAEAFAAWKRLTDTEHGLSPTSLGRLASDPVSAALDVVSINNEIAGRFLSAQEEETYSLLKDFAQGLEDRIAAERTPRMAPQDEVAIETLGDRISG